MITIGIHQPQYLPWLGLIDRASRCDVFVVLDSVPYSKNYFYNRNRIKTANGLTWLTVPVLTKGCEGQDFTETRIDNRENWREKHWKSIFYSYKKAPFFEESCQRLENILKREWEFLVDLCLETFHYILEIFDIRTRIVRASELGVQGRKEGLVISICKQLQATHYLSGPDGKNYLTPDLWAKQNMMVDFQNYIHPIYRQLHGEFIPNLSVIDLIFNYGGLSGLEILTSGQPEYFNGQGNSISKGNPH